jgi:hypothetical protein
LMRLVEGASATTAMWECYTSGACLPNEFSAWRHSEAALE